MFDRVTGTSEQDPEHWMVSPLPTTTEKGVRARIGRQKNSVLRGGIILCELLESMRMVTFNFEMRP